MNPADSRTPAPPVSHVFLTRFNLPTPGPESLVRAQDGWLRTRWELFNRYTVPSMQAQTSHDFEWLIYFDSQSPAWLLECVAQHTSTGLYHALLRTSVSSADLLADISAVVRVPGAKLLTTNLDNDDGLAANFAERLASVTSDRPRTAIYLVNGVIRKNDRLYRRTDRDNAFCSVLEDWDGALTCWHDWHILLGRHMPVIEVRGRPAWLQVVHHTNVSNRVHGHLISPEQVSHEFGMLVADAKRPRTRQIVVDRIVLAPARRTRDGLRAWVKAILMAIGGKRGLDRFKELSTKPRRKAIS